MSLAANAGPWFADWNHAVLQALFRVMPFNGWRIALAEIATYNPLASTWIFALVFYIFWWQKDERTLWRRSRLLETALSCTLTVLLTLAIRPWVSWPSPIRVASFQTLYPSYLGTVGNANCFPSHSTLVYLMVGLGFAGLNRKISVSLVAFTFAAISFPRVYLGGHYPIDILASTMLAIVATVSFRLWCAHPRIGHFLEWAASRGALTEIFLFLWVFELGEGFRSGMDALLILGHAGRFLRG